MPEKLQPLIARLGAIDRSAHWRAWVLGAVLVTLVSLTVLTQLDGVLRGMRTAGRPAFGVASLASLDPAQAPEVVRVWRGFDGVVDPEIGRAPFASARTVARLHVLIDGVLLVPAYALLVIALLFRGRRWVARWQRAPEGPVFVKRVAQAAGGVTAEPEPLFDAVSEELESISAASSPYSALVRLTGLATVGVLALALVDEIENLLTWVVLDIHWPALREAGGWVAFLGRALGFAAQAKVLLGAGVAAVGILLLFTIGRLYGDGARRLWRVVWGLRAHVVLVLTLAGALLFAPQVPDVIRRANLLQTLTAAAGSVFLALALFVVARRVTHNLSGLEGRRPIPRADLWAGGLLGAAIVAAFVGWGWGLLVPAATVVVVLGLGRLVPGAEEPTRAAAPVPGSRMPATWPQSAVFSRALAVAPIVALGLAMIRAVSGDFVVTRGWADVPGEVSALFRGIGGGFLRAVGEADALAQLGRLALGVALMAFASWLHSLFARQVGVPPPRRSDPWIRVAWLLGIAGGAVWVGVLVDVWATASGLGTLGVLFGFAVLAALMLGLLAIASETFTPPRGLRLLGASRLPVFGLFAVWFLVMTFRAPVEVHDVRTFASDPGPAPVTAGDVLDRWTEQNRLPSLELLRTTREQVGSSRRAVPMIFVSTAGGGIRAAFWTGLVLDCLFEAPLDAPDLCARNAPREDESRSEAVIAASGVSGGSLGLVEYAAYLASRANGRPPTTGTWPEDRLGEDYLGATLAWGLFVEFPKTLLGTANGLDRAAVMECAWERSWASGACPKGERDEREGPLSLGLEELWERHPQVPLLLLNGTDVLHGCRFNASVLNAAATQPGGSCLSLHGFDPEGEDVEVFPATIDLADLLCSGGRDVRLSTAALLSARFSFVSPSGRMEECRAEGDAAAEVPPVVSNVVDGGYLETSGASTALELWRGLAGDVTEYNRLSPDSCVVPFFVQIDNGYDVPEGPSGEARLSEIGAPAAAFVTSARAHAVVARAASALEFGRPLPDVEVLSGARTLTDRWVRLRPLAHPGPRAPLGWALSETTMEDLRVQLATQNRAAVNRIRGWMTGDLRCEPRA